MMTRVRFWFSSFPLSTVALLLAVCGFLLGCGDVEDTNTADARSTLNPSASYSVSQSPPSPETVTIVTTNIIGGSTNLVNGVTNVVGSVTNIVTSFSNGPASITSLRLTASGDGSSWSVQADDNTGGAYAGTATGPVLSPPGSGNAYETGATIALFSIHCTDLTGDIAAVAIAPIPIEVVRTSTTNGTNVVVGRHGQHALTPQNAQFRISATLVREGIPYTLTGTAPVSPATLIW